TYDVNLDLREAFAGQTAKEDDPQELTLPQLRAVIERQEGEGPPRPAMLVELHRKFAIPFACVVFGLVGVPLGIEPARAVRSRGFAMSPAVLFVYYILLSAGQGFAEQGTVPAWLGLWLPNIVFGVSGVVLARRAARERTLLGVLPDLVGQLRDLLTIRPRAGASR